MLSRVQIPVVVAVAVERLVLEAEDLVGRSVEVKEVRRNSALGKLREWKDEDLKAGVEEKLSMARLVQYSTCRS